MIRKKWDFASSSTSDNYRRLTRIWGAHRYVGHISKSSLGLIHRQKAASLSWAPKGHYGFWRVELRCHLVRTWATVVRQELDLMCPWDTGQVEILLLLKLWLCLNHEGSCGAGVLSNRGSNCFWGASNLPWSPRRLKFCPGCVMGLLCDFGKACAYMSPPVKGDVGADFLCKFCGALYKKTEIKGKCCSAIWYHKITTRIFYSVPGEIKTYADLISYDFGNSICLETGERNQITIDLLYLMESLQKKWGFCSTTEMALTSLTAKVDQVATVSARRDTTECFWGSHGLTFTWADNLQFPTTQRLFSWKVKQQIFT